jgi:hypothetical protein
MYHPNIAMVHIVDMLGSLDIAIHLLHMHRYRTIRDMELRKELLFQIDYRRLRRLLLPTAHMQQMMHDMNHRNIHMG